MFVWAGLRHIRGVLCDWWSTTCEEPSAILFRVYSYCFIIFVILLGHFAWGNGSLMTVQAFTELGDEMRRVARQWLKLLALKT